jgi:hypothetical protein
MPWFVVQNVALYSRYDHAGEFSTMAVFEPVDAFTSATNSRKNGNDCWNPPRYEGTWMLMKQLSRDSIPDVNAPIPDAEPRRSVEWT